MHTAQIQPLTESLSTARSTCASTRDEKQRTAIEAMDCSPFRGSKAEQCVHYAVPTARRAIVPSGCIRHDFRSTAGSHSGFRHGQLHSAATLLGAGAGVV